MKVIFLDVDGVLCTPLSFRLNRLRRLPAEQRAAYGRTILSAVERLSNGRHGPTREM